MFRPFELEAFKISFPTISKSIIKAIAWLSITCIIGGLPLILVMVLSSFNVIEANGKIHEILNDLFLLFLCCAIITEVSVEALLCKIKFGKYSYMLFIASAGIVIVTVSIAYIIVFFRKPENYVKLNKLWIFQIYVITFTVFYSIFLKTIMFIEEDKTYKLCQRLQSSS